MALATFIEFRTISRTWRSKRAFTSGVEHLSSPMPVEKRDLQDHSLMEMTNAALFLAGGLKGFTGACFWSLCADTKRSIWWLSGRMLSFWLKVTPDEGHTSSNLMELFTSKTSPFLWITNLSLGCPHKEYHHLVIQTEHAML